MADEGPTERVEEYLDNFARHLIHELEPVVHVRPVATNSDVLGAYAEAAMRRFIRRFVNPIRVSRGAILKHPRPAKLRQRDVIVWAPFPSPALFDVDDFALVPQSSAFGVLETKSSSYDAGVAALEEFVEEAPADVGNLAPHPDDDPRRAVMGVIGVIEGNEEGELRPLRIGGALRFEPDVVRKYIERTRL